MKFKDFSRELIKNGANMKDVYRLDHEGRREANDQFRGEWEAGRMPEIRTENEFQSYCTDIGRDFVLDNLGELFVI